MNVAVLSGGVGGARFVCGIVDVAGAAATSVIGNVGDDVEVLGLHVSPDLDSILYALAGVADERRGWGRSDETAHATERRGHGFTLAVRAGGDDRPSHRRAGVVDVAEHGVSKLGTRLFRQGRKPALAE